MKMKIRYLLLAILLITAILFSSCANSVNNQNTEHSDKESITESSTNLPTEKATETSTEKEDAFKSIRSSDEEWIKYGLSAYEKGKKVTNFKDFFSNKSNMTYLTLYDHMFVFDKNKSVPIAEALFSFIYNKYGIDGITDIDKRCEYKTEYLKSLGLDVEYTQTKEVEAFFASMDFKSDSTCKYIMSFDNVTYYFKDFSAGSPAQYHGFLYFSTTGLRDMIEYLKSNNLSEGLNTERKFNYYMTFNGTNYSKTDLSNGNIYINDSYSTLHEAIHAMGITNLDNIWLREGICNYFGKAFGFNDQIAASYIQILSMVKQGYFDERIAAGDKSAILYKKVYDNYTSLGGKIDSVDTFDLHLFFDVSAKVELDENSYVTLGEAYKTVNDKECDSIGKELSYDQATSMISYLVDNYGIQKVLEAYRTQDIGNSFGKGYEDLKAEWLVYLYK